MSIASDCPAARLPERIVVLFAIVLLGLQSVRAESLDPSVPDPSAVLGLERGERPATYHEVLTYMQAVANASDRVRLHSYGETPTGRKLWLLTISSPQNLARLAQIDAQLAELGDARSDERHVEQLIEDLPAIAWMGYGIHGDEISGPDAALTVVHRLAAGGDAQTRELLDKLVIYVDPMFNPDGRERSLAHQTAFSRRMPTKDLQDLRHRAFWPQGRTNHYLFDLNRDALYMVQQESRARLAAMVKAQPQFFVDAHEMESTSTYLFAVPAGPHNPFLPAEIHSSWSDFAADHAAAFDQESVSYYTRSWVELFFPGYFDVLPAYYGATPMLYEQSGTSGTTVTLPNGLDRTYLQAVDNQVRSSFASLTTAARNKEQLLRRWWSARKRAAAGGREAKVWLVPPADTYQFRRLVEVLHTQGVQVERLAQPVRASKLTSLWGEEDDVALPAGTLRVRSAQPLGGLVHNLFNFHVPMSTEFLQQERRALDRGADTLIYDTTAWSVGHAFGVDVYWSSRTPVGEWNRFGADEPIAPAPPAVGNARYGYLYRDSSLAVTARLLTQGVKVRAATKPFSQGGVQYEAGTLLIRNDDQSESVLERLQAEQGASETAFIELTSARVESGPDLGDDAFTLLVSPSLGILVGHGTSPTSVGAVWHAIDAQLGMPATLLDISRLCGFDLSRYNVLVLPDTWGAQHIAGVLEQGAQECLTQWVKSGGTLVALAGGAFALAQTELTATQSRADAFEKYPPLVLGRDAHTLLKDDFIRAGGAGNGQDEKTQTATWTFPVVGTAARTFLGDSSSVYEFPQELPTLAQWLENVPAADELKNAIGPVLRKYLPKGAYMRVDIKPEHWLGFGLPAKVSALVRQSDALIVEGGSDLVGRYAPPRELALSGLIWPEAVGYLAETAWLVREKRGRGQIILFANDPVFRGYSLQTQRLFVNAVVLGPAYK